jgi:hypothetical protein
MVSGRVFACSLLVLVASITGCKRDLGDCNLDGTTEDGSTIPGPAAFDTVYRITDGQPMYEGQAIVQSTCGDGSFCHSPAASGQDRIGTPAGLNFDISLVCTDDVSTCQTNPPYDDRVRRFEGNQGTIRSWAEGMIQEVRAGAMPPGEAGRRVRDNTPWLREDGSELPSIESDEAKEILRNWLACGSPAIGRTEPAPTEAEQLQPCGSETEELICVYSGPSGDLPDPTWRDIYWTIMFTECVACHGPVNSNTDQNPNNPLGGQIPGGASPAGLAVLDLTGSDVNDTTNWPDESYDVVVDVSTSTAGPCAGAGFVIESGENSEDSIMIEKMRGIQTCGGPMPLSGNLLPAPLVDVVADWAAIGAPLD